MNRPQLSKALAEAVGTFALVFASCGSAMVAERFPGAISGTAMSVISGLVVAAMIYAVGHISGAHFNPAVTAAFAVAKRFPKGQVLVYWGAQLLGGLLAVTVLSKMLPAGISYGATIPIVASFQALLWECVLSFFLMFVITAVATDARAEGTMAGAAIGATVMFCVLLGGPITGASMNPARTFAPAVFQGRMDVLWIYVAGPMIGAIVAALFYEVIRCEPELAGSTKESQGCC